MEIQIQNYIMACKYQLPYVNCCEKNNLYHTHFDNGKDHFKFGGKDFFGLIKIDWAARWSTGSSQYNTEGWLGDEEGATYVDYPITPVYLMVEEWEDTDSYQDFPSKVRLATEEEILEAHHNKLIQDEYDEIPEILDRVDWNSEASNSSNEYKIVSTAEKLFFGELFHEHLSDEGSELVKNLMSLFKNRWILSSKYTELLSLGCTDEEILREGRLVIESYFYDNWKNISYQIIGKHRLDDCLSIINRNISKAKAETFCYTVYMESWSWSGKRFYEPTKVESFKKFYSKDDATAKQRALSFMNKEKDNNYLIVYMVQTEEPVSSVR